MRARPRKRDGVPAATNHHMQCTNPRKRVALFENSAVDRGLSCKSRHGRMDNHLAFAACLNDAPLLPRR